MMDEGHVILTVEEVARYLKIGKRTVYRLLNEGAIPAFKVGGSWRFSQHELDAWIRRRSTGRLHMGTEQEQPVTLRGSVKKEEDV